MAEDLIKAPWKIELDGIGVTDSAGVTICVAPAPDMASCKARTTLIAAAPELLACVEGLVAAWGGEVESDEAMNGGDVVDWVCGAMLEFRAALAKAKGEHR